MPADRGGGPGTYKEKGVVCTMGAPFGKGKSPGSEHGMTGTFDHARTGGGSGSNIPTTVRGDLGGAKSAPKANARDSMTRPGLTTPAQRGAAY